VAGREAVEPLGRQQGPSERSKNTTHVTGKYDFEKDTKYEGLPFFTNRSDKGHSEIN